MARAACIGTLRCAPTPCWTRRERATCSWRRSSRPARGRTWSAGGSPSATTCCSRLRRRRSSSRGPGSPACRVGRPFDNAWRKQGLDEVAGRLSDAHRSAELTRPWSLETLPQAYQPPFEIGLERRFRSSQPPPALRRDQPAGRRLERPERIARDGARGASRARSPRRLRVSPATRRGPPMPRRRPRCGPAGEGHGHGPGTAAPPTRARRRLPADRRPAMAPAAAGRPPKSGR